MDDKSEVVDAERENDTVPKRLRKTSIIILDSLTEGADLKRYENPFLSKIFTIFRINGQWMDMRA